MISTTEIETKIKNNNVVAIKFYSEWCKSCRNYDYYLTNDQSDYELISVDYDLNDDIIEYYDISILPTIIIYKFQQFSEKITGFITKTKFLEKIKNADI
jgi:thiol:disulfide interchange protein